MSIKKIIYILVFANFPTLLIARANIKINHLSFQGDGCEAENSLATVDSVNNIVKFLPGNMTINLLTEDDFVGAVSCQLKFKIQVPKGLQIAMTQDRLYGQEKIIGQGEVSVFLNGRLFYDNGIRSLNVLGGKKETNFPSNRTFALTTTRKFQTTIWSPCGDENLEFIADGDIVASKDFDDTSTSQVSLDSAWIYRIQIRECQE